MILYDFTLGEDDYSSLASDPANTRRNCPILACETIPPAEVPPGGWPEGMFPGDDPLKRPIGLAQRTMALQHHRSYFRVQVSQRIWKYYLEIRDIVS
jgi:hypothetical protein